MPKSHLRIASSADPSVRAAPRRQLERQHHTLDVIAVVIDDVPDDIERIVGSHVRIAYEPLELVVHSPPHCRGFAAPMLKARMLEHALIHFPPHRYRYLVAKVEQPLRCTARCATNTNLDNRSPEAIGSCPHIRASASLNKLD